MCLDFGSGNFALSPLYHHLSMRGDPCCFNDYVVDLESVVDGLDYFGGGVCVVGEEKVMCMLIRSKGGS